METAKLTELVSLILAMSVASERLVEIVKGFVPSLDKPNLSDETAEGRRRAYLQILAVVAGCITAFLSRDYVPSEIGGSLGPWAFIGLGLLASGGSGFWNAILTYVTKVKEIKSAESEIKKTRAQAMVALNLSTVDK